MATESVTPITDHADVAVSRLPQRYKDPAKTWLVDAVDASAWEVVLQALVKPAQTFETVANEILSGRGLSVAEGVNLDRIGAIVGQDRKGVGDSRYRQLISGKIAENNSEGTAADLVAIASVLLGTFVNEVDAVEFFPAKVRVEYSLPEGELTIDPLLVQESMTKARAAGIGVSTLRYVDADYFGFDSDPDAGGYGSLDGGGTLYFGSYYPSLLE